MASFPTSLLLPLLCWLHPPLPCQVLHSCSVSALGSLCSPVLGCWIEGLQSTAVFPGRAWAAPLPLVLQLLQPSGQDPGCSVGQHTGTRRIPQGRSTSLLVCVPVPSGPASCRPCLLIPWRGLSPKPCELEQPFVLVLPCCTTHPRDWYMLSSCSCSATKH